VNFQLSKYLSNILCQTRLALVALSVLMASSQALAQTDSQITHTLSLGSYFNSGDYGEAIDTEILYFPLTYDLQVNNWRFRLLVPHLQVEGLGNVLINVGGVTRAFATDEVTSSRGLGDIVASATYQFEAPTENGPFIDISLDVKVPTADEDKSLGTGEYDYGVQVDIAQALSTFTVFGTLGYRFRGKSVMFAGLKDSPFVQLGVARRLNETWTTGVFYDFRAAASQFSGETHELLPYLSWSPNPKWSVTGFAGWGFTEDSPDYSMFARLSYSW